MLRLLFRSLYNVFAAALSPLWWLLRAIRKPRGNWIRIVVRPRVVAFERPRPWWTRLVAAAATSQTTSLYAINELVDRVVDDRQIVGVLWVLPRLQCGWTACEELREAITRLIAADKRVTVALEQGGGNREAFVASAAQQVFMSPRAGLNTLGLKLQAHYLRPLLQKVGVHVEPFARKRYKTAVERLTRDEMSEPQREQLRAMLDRHDTVLTRGLAARLDGNEGQARAMFERGMLRGQDLVEVGFVDALAYPDELSDSLSNGNDPVRFIEAPRYIAHNKAKLFKRLRAKPYVAIIAVHGAISETGSPSAQRGAVVAALRRVRNDKRALGAVLHINSPGGSADASDLIHREVVRLKDKKPIVACFGDVAASGGYYIAAPCNAIVAHALSLTGSIGVVSAQLVASELLGKLGVTTEVLKTAPHADMLGIHRPLSSEERTILDRELDGFYSAFVSLVSQGRNLSEDRVEAIAQGRVWSGLDALEHGLIDQTGGLQDALNAARSLTGLPAQRTKSLETRFVWPRPFDQPPAPRARVLELFGADPALLDVAALAHQGHRALFVSVDLPTIR